MAASQLDLNKVSILQGTLSRSKEGRLVIQQKGYGQPGLMGVHVETTPVALKEANNSS